MSPSSSTSDLPPESIDKTCLKTALKKKILPEIVGNSHEWCNRLVSLASEKFQDSDGNRLSRTGAGQAKTMSERPLQPDVLDDISRWREYFQSSDISLEYPDTNHKGLPKSNLTRVETVALSSSYRTLGHVHVGWLKQGIRASMPQDQYSVESAAVCAVLYEYTVEVVADIFKNEDTDIKKQLTGLLGSKAYSTQSGA